MALRDTALAVVEAAKDGSFSSASNAKGKKSPHLGAGPLHSPRPLEERRAGFSVA